MGGKLSEFGQGMGLAFRGLSKALRSKVVRRAYLRYVAAVLVLALAFEYLAFSVLKDNLPAWIDQLVQWASGEGSQAQDPSWWTRVLDWLRSAQGYAVLTLSWILGVIVWLLAAILAPYLAFALVNALVPMFTESIFMGALHDEDLPLHRNLELRQGRPFWKSFSYSMLRLVRYLSVSAIFVLVGLVPVVGTIISTVLSAIWTTHNVSYELLEPYFDRRDASRQDDKRMLAQFRSLRFGFATPVALLLAIPVVGVFFFAMAQASTAALVSRMESKALSL